MFSCWFVKISCPVDRRAPQGGMPRRLTAKVAQMIGKWDAYDESNATFKRVRRRGIPAAKPLGDQRAFVYRGGAAPTARAPSGRGTRKRAVRQIALRP